MADYTEEQRVKQVYPDAEIIGLPHGKVAVWSPSVPAGGPLGYLSEIQYSGTREQRRAAAWADASRRLGNEFVEDVGPLAERKEE